MQPHRWIHNHDWRSSVWRSQVAERLIRVLWELLIRDDERRLRIVHRFSKTSRAAPSSRPMRAASLLWLPLRPAPTPRRHRCFAVFSLLIILLDLVRRRVVHCTRLRTPRPATRPRMLPVASHVLLLLNLAPRIHPIIPIESRYLFCSERVGGTSCNINKFYKQFLYDFGIWGKFWNFYSVQHEICMKSRRDGWDALCITPSF